MKKLLTYAILPIATIALVYLIFMSITKPVNFNKEQAAREKVAIERLKDIRTLQTTYKSAYNHYAPTMDSLIDFYKNGKITIVKQIGSVDDSVAVAKKLVKRENILIPVKDTLFNDRPDFDVEALRYIPFSDNDTIIMSTVIKVVSGVDVPLFEAKIPYGVRPAPGQPFRGLLKDMDEQLIVNLNAERVDTGRYPGLMVGSIDNANNNAGNWE